MINYDYDTCEKMRQIFAEHCYLDMDEYEEISGRLMDLVAEVQEMDAEGTYEDAERKASELGVIYEFLMNVHRISLYEYNELCNMTGRIMEAAELARDGVLLPISADPRETYD